jgi:hypothetical protein
MGATILRPNRKDEPGRGPHLVPIRQRIESIFWTCKGTLTLERHRARTLPGSASASWPTYPHSPPPSPSTTNSGRPSRALINYTT